jgi:hypothetical protein
MKKSAVLVAFALLAGMTAPAFAGCDIKDEDTQGTCVDKCYFEYLSVRNRFATSPAGAEAAKGDRDACYTKCGCEPGKVRE